METNNKNRHICLFVLFSRLSPTVNLLTEIDWGRGRSKFPSNKRTFLNSLNCHIDNSVVT